jgi:hypothetical protein
MKMVAVRDGAIRREHVLTHQRVEYQGGVVTSGQALRHAVVTGLNVPGGMTFGPDDRLYISDFSAVPAPVFGVGRILRFDIAPGW